MDNRTRGAKGEEQAAFYLEQKGYRIIARNFRCRLGEIDLIAEKSGYLAFVEVKLRKNNRYGEAREFVNWSKQRKIILAAEFWLAGHPTRLQPRFDVIEISAPGAADGPVSINHIADAFQLN